MDENDARVAQDIENRMQKGETSMVELLNRANLHVIGLSELVQALSSHIADQKPNAVNILSGSKMAEYLGISKKSLEHRRVRGQFQAAPAPSSGGIGSIT
ncbi:hypothetical protein [Stutzerimonas stutzeri]|uniref:hypothetical protein n=1 Tax=Stutzerimonas stutzeri TaxID=316 RepID=UPI0015E35672|nr:hypothetical protein [Stutzerimonas stutzeri]MBA1278121.1 hypothetical protein [Stutzerimonas stutzeri]